MAFITGTGWITAGGMGRGRQTNCFDMTPGRLPKIRRKSVLTRPFAHFGRMDAFSKLGLAGISLALQDAGHHEWTQKRPIALVASTVQGCIQTDADYFDTAIERNDMASPALFSYTLSNCFLGEAACCFGINGLSYVIYDTQFDRLSSLDALLLHIDLDECDMGLAGIVNAEPPSELPLPGRPLPGAAFVMVEKTPPSNETTYGPIESAQNDTILFNHKEITSFLHLIQACLTVFHGSA
ncbi:MAG: hypothetical protein K9M96_11060 [Deltaproteobacteria bacterium]|nr:hypothetical protein [Deltaproteobacteria bacterium]